MATMVYKSPARCVLHLPNRAVFPQIQLLSKFLQDTLNANQFPLLFVLPSGDELFIVANTQSMIFNWKTNTETRLPDIPNGVRVT